MSATGTIADVLAGIVGSEHVRTDLAERQFFSADISFESYEVADLVAQPGTAEEVAAIVEAANGAGLAVVPRGGGMSYTQGYTPARTAAVLLDLRRLNRIREINTEDMYVIAEVGCTWEQLYEALKEQGVRTPYYGPLSGKYATVGGACSQNSVFWGSGVHSSAADCVLGLEVVLAGGTLVRTGSWARTSTNAFLRHNGPDLTGIFTGDTGAFGVKTAAVFRLVPFPAVSLGGSFAVPGFAASIDALAELARSGYAAELYQLDPFYHDVLARAGLSFLAEHEWTVHFCVDGADREVAEAQVAVLKRIAARHGTEIDDTTVHVFKSNPFGAVQSVLLGPEGECWLPIHAFLPWSRAHAAARAVFDLFEKHRETMERLNVKTSILSLASGKDWVFEPSYYWHDELGDFRLEKISPEAASQWRSIPADRETRSVVLELRRQLAKTFDELGCCHIQVAKYYEYGPLMEGPTWELTRTIKQALDRDGLVNPGSLGL